MLIIGFIVADIAIVYFRKRSRKKFIVINLNSTAYLSFLDRDCSGVVR